MTLRSLLALLFTFAIVAGGCKKREPSGNPCDGLINETPPAKIMVKFVDRANGQNLILSNGLKASDFTVINADMNKPFTNWRIVSEMGVSPLNGMLELLVFHETAGQYHYQIKLTNIGTATLAYTVSKAATDNPCKPHAYPISDIKITDHPFKPFTHEGKSYSNIMVLEL